MFSKLKYPTIFLLSLSLVSCGLKVGEKNKSQNVAKIAGADCLDQSTANLKLFFKGYATNEQVADSLQCLQGALTTFKDNVRGKSKDTFTMDEIGQFATNQFIKDGSSMPAELLEQIGKLKAMLVGGSDQVITKNEIELIKDLIARYKPELVRLNPHMKVLIGQWQPSGSESENEAKLKAAQSAIKSLMMRLSQNMAATGKSYELSDLLKLAVEGLKFAKSDAETIKTVSSADLVILRFKNMFISEGTALRSGDWSMFLATVGEIFGQKLRYDYFIKPFASIKTNKQTLKQYGIIGSEVTTFIKNLMTNGNFKRSQIPNTEIFQLAEGLQKVASNLKINEDLVKQVSAIRVIFTGNREKALESWSTDDFEKLSQKIPNLLDYYFDIKTNFDILNSKKDELPSLKDFKYFEQAETQFKGKLIQFSEAIEGNYDLTNVKPTLVNLSTTLLEGDLKLPAKLDELLMLALSGKKLLLGNSSTVLTKEEMQTLLLILPRAYGNISEFKHYVDLSKLDDPANLENTRRAAKKIVETVAFELSTIKPSKVFSIEELTAVILAAQKADLLKTKLKPQSLSSVLSFVCNQLLNSAENRLADIKPDNFNLGSLMMLAGEVRTMLLTQNSIVEIFAKKSFYNKVQLVEQLKTKEPNVGELVKLTDVPGYLNFNSKSYLKILSDTNDIYKPADLTLSNLSMTLSRLLIKSLSKDAESVKTLKGLKDYEFKAGFDQIKGVLIDLGLIGEKSADGFVASRFREADLFLANSDGSDISCKLVEEQDPCKPEKKVKKNICEMYANYSEIHQLALHIIAGSSRATDIAKAADDRCVKDSKADDVDKNFEEVCLIDVINKDEGSFVELPKFLEMRSKHSLEENQIYILALLKAAGYVPNEQKLVKSSDAKLFTHVVQYVEMIFFSFDANRDGLLDKAEAFTAFPRFRNIIASLIPPAAAFAIKPKDYRGIFIYLLKNQTVPDIEKLGLGDPSVKEFLSFIKDDCETKVFFPPLPPGEKPTAGVNCDRGWDISVSRVDLGKIFNYIADATKPKVCPVTP